MKNFKYFIVGVVACCCVLLTGCFFDSNSIKNLEVTYTVGQQFFVGEEWTDDLIAGTAIYRDGSEKSLTREDLTIDTSKFDNTKVGTYKIYCEYESAKVDFKVYVVDEMTDAYSINRLTNSMVENSFKEVDNHLELKCTFKTSGPAIGTYYKQTLEYKVIDNYIYEHYMLELTDESETDKYLITELLYVGTETEGVMSAKVDDSDEGAETPSYVVNTKLGSLQEFETSIKEFATALGIQYLDGSQFVNFYTNTYPYCTPSKLVKTDTGYQMTLLDNKSIIFVDNKLSELNGIKIEYETNIPSQLNA